MLKTYFTRECTQTTYSAGPAGPYLDDLSHWLAQRGFSPRTVRDRLFGAKQFASWADTLGVAGQALHPAVLNDFRRYLAQNGQLRYASGNATVRCLGAQHFLTFLRAQGLLSASAGAVPSPHPPSSCVRFGTGCTCIVVSPSRRSVMTARSSSMSSRPWVTSRHSAPPQAYAPSSWSVPTSTAKARPTMG